MEPDAGTLQGDCPESHRQGVPYLPLQDHPGIKDPEGEGFLLPQGADPTLRRRPSLVSPIPLGRIAHHLPDHLLASEGQGLDVQLMGDLRPE